MRIETKLIDKGIPLINKSPAKGENPAFFYFNFEVLPKVGEMVLIQYGSGKGIFIVVAVVHEIFLEGSQPILVMEKWEEETRHSILERYGWITGEETKPSAIEIERIYIDN